MNKIKSIVKRYGGRLERDGLGGWEALAPNGMIWTEAEVWCYPIPISECETKEERQEMLKTAISFLSAGVSPIA